MDRGEPDYLIIYSEKAQRQLVEIYAYNLKARGHRAADSYNELLTKEILRLRIKPDSGTVIEIRPELRFVLIKKNRNKNSNGHIAVYRFDPNIKTVQILYVFHTKQGWQNNL